MAYKEINIYVHNGNCNQSILLFYTHVMDFFFKYTFLVTKILLLFSVLKLSVKEKFPYQKLSKM